MTEPNKTPSSVYSLNYTYLYLQWPYKSQMLFFMFMLFQYSVATCYWESGEGYSILLLHDNNFVHFSSLNNNGEIMCKCVTQYNVHKWTLFFFGIFLHNSALGSRSSAKRMMYTYLTT